MAKSKKAGGKEKPVRGIRVTRPMVAGIDIGSSEHWVCGPPGADGERMVRVFRTTTPQLDRLVNWLVSQGVESVAMESTSVYWIPIYELLESRGIEAVLVNARQLHNVPGRKTDMADCQWLQLLHSCGLLRGSFRPGDTICRLRALQRQLSNLVAQRSRCVQWMQKSLDQMNVQVHRAVSDITGQTGMAIIRAIIDGERDPIHLATLRDPRCRKSVEEIAEHLTGTWREEHLFNLESSLRLFDGIEQEIATYETRLREELEQLQPPEMRDQSVPPHPNPAKEKSIKRTGDQELRTALWRMAGVDLTRIDGIGATAAQTIITEVGLNLSAFPDEHHFVSWLRLTPRTPISGGKPLKKKSKGLGANRVSATLRMAALTVHRSKSALGGFFRRMSRRKGAAVAVFATARKLATLVYRMLRHGQDYVDIGERAYEQRFQQRRLASLRDTAESLGFQVVPKEAHGAVSG